MKSLIKILATHLVMLAAFSIQAEQNNVSAVIETKLGNIEIEVYPYRAPLSSSSFLSAIDSDLFRDSKGVFYRVVHSENDTGSPKIEVIQGGIVDRTKSLPPIPIETTQQTGILHTDGVISLARGATTGSGTVFFICIGDQPSLDYGGKRNPDGKGFAAFGRVTKGMDVVRRIQQMKTHEESPGNAMMKQWLIEPVGIVKAYRKS